VTIPNGRLDINATPWARSGDRASDAITS